MKLLITQATGFLGRNLLDTLIPVKEISEIVALYPEETGPVETARQSPRPIHWQKGSLSDPDFLRAIPPDLEYVIHSGPQLGFPEENSQPVSRLASDTQHLVSTLKGQQQLQRIIYLSSFAAIDRPPGSKPPYLPLNASVGPHSQTEMGKVHLEAEGIVRQSGLPHTILRPVYVYGPYAPPGSLIDRLIRDTAVGNPYTRFPYTGQISAMYAGDLGELIWSAARNTRCLNQAYFAANPEPVEIQQTFRTLCALMKKNYRPYPVPRLLRPWLKQTMMKEGLSPQSANALFESYYVADTTPLYRDISYRPYYGFDGGLTRTVQWYRQQGLLEPG